MESKQAPPVIPYLFPLFFVVLALGVITFGILQALSSPEGRQVPMTGPGSIVTVLQRDLATGTPVTLTQQGASITLRAKGQNYVSTFDSRLDILQFLQSAGIPTHSRRFLSDVTVKYETPGQATNVAASVLSLLPLLIFGALIFFMMRRRRGTGR